MYSSDHQLFMIKHSLSGDDSLKASSTVTFDTLYKKYVRKVYKKCLSMTKDFDAAQDYTQDIFLKAFTKLHSFQNQSSFSTWLYAITHNYCLDQLQLKKRLPLERLPDEVLALAIDENEPRLLEAKLLFLEEVTKELSQPEVQLLRLKYEQNLTIKQLSEQYQLSESAVKMRLKRVRDKIAGLYQNRPGG